MKKVTFVIRLLVSPIVFFLLVCMALFPIPCGLILIMAPIIAFGQFIANDKEEANESMKAFFGILVMPFVGTFKFVRDGKTGFDD